MKSSHLTLARKISVGKLMAGDLVPCSGSCLQDPGPVLLQCCGEHMRVLEVTLWVRDDQSILEITSGFSRKMYAFMAGSVVALIHQCRPFPEINNKYDEAALVSPISWQKDLVLNRPQLVQFRLEINDLLHVKRHFCISLHQ